MRRQSLVKFDAPPSETVVDMPKPVGREVLVRIERCGLCHSDLHTQDGYADLGGGKKLDITQCRDCVAGDENLCAKQRFLGLTLDGGFASHVLVPDAKYLLDYDPLSVNLAATLMCSGVTAYGALKRLVDRWATSRNGSTNCAPEKSWVALFLRTEARPS